MGKNRFPAVYIAHTPSGPTKCCDEHAKKIVALFRFMGAHVHLEYYFGDEECANCRNENGRGGGDGE